MPVSPCDDDYSNNHPYHFHNHEMVARRDQKWDVKLRDAITSEGVNVVAGVEEALGNMADVNSLCGEETSNLALAFNTITLEPVREEVIRTLVQKGTNFADEREENEIYSAYVSKLSPDLLEQMMYSEYFKSVQSGKVLSAMYWVIIQRKPNAVYMMRELIQQARIIFDDLKETNKTDDDGDENDEYMDLDDFLSKTIHGHTLLHLVIERKLHDADCMSLLNLLIVHGARVCTKDEYGHTPRELVFILIGSSRKRQDMNVIAMLEMEEALQESQNRKVDREKIEVIGTIGSARGRCLNALTHG